MLVYCVTGAAPWCAHRVLQQGLQLQGLQRCILRACSNELWVGMFVCFKFDLQLKVVS
jgi:hypothetical protein